MAWGEKYNAIWYDSESVKHEIKLLLEDYETFVYGDSVAKDIKDSGGNKYIYIGTDNNVNAYAGVASTLDFMTSLSSVQGQRCFVWAGTGETITINHNSPVTGAFQTLTSTNLVLTSETGAYFERDAILDWVQITTPEKIEIEKKQTVPCVINRRGDKEVQIGRHILGSELIFNFYVAVSAGAGEADIDDIDSIVQSEWKEWKVEKYYNSTLDWTGYLLPENYSREWIASGSYYAISLSASDGLARLKEIEFTNFSSGAQYTDRVSLITGIKRALEHLEFELDFRVQLGTNCTTGVLMASTDCALDKVTHDSRRFTKTEDGREVNEDCYTMIEKILAPFNCYLIQAEGKYWIVNAQEIDSYYFPITWSGLTVGTRTAKDLAVVLGTTTVKYRLGSEVQKVRPIEQANTIFKDRNVADNLLSNGDFSTASTSEWTKSADIQTFTTPAYGANYELQATVNVDLNGAPSATPYFYSDAESVTVRGSSDQLSVECKIRCALIDMDAAFAGPSYYEKAAVTCRIRKGSPTGTIINSTSTQSIQIGNDDATYTTYNYLFPITATDNYYIEFLIDEVSGAWTDYDEIDIRFDDIYWTVLYSDGSDITFDRFYSATNSDSTFTDVLTTDLFFGDSQQDNDIGAFKISGTRTDAWDRYGKSEDKTLQVLYIQNLIENFSRYKDYLRVTIFDPDHDILPYSLLEIGSKTFQILSVSEIYAGGQRRELQCELLEVLNTAVTTSVTSQQLTSVDGQSSSQSTVVSSAGATPTLDQVTDQGNTTTNFIEVGSLKIGSSKWDLKLNGNDLEFEYNGTVVAKLTTAGYLSTADDQEIFDTGL